MLRGGLEPWHVIIILGLIVVLFGSRKLPDAARSVGQSMRIFKSEMKAASTDGTQVTEAPQALSASNIAPAAHVEASPVAVAEQR